MKRFLLFCATFLMLSLVGCTQFDDSRLWDAIDELEDAQKELEDEQEKMQDQLDAQQTLLNALANNLSIVSITPTEEGFLLTFSNGSTITVKHGEKGEQGDKGDKGDTGEKGDKGDTGDKGEDGADGKDGQNGADGKDGEDGEDGDSFFQSVTWDDEYVYFTLTDGTNIIIPRVGRTPISLITSDGYYRAEGTIMATYKYGFVVGDGTANILVWLGTTHNYEIGSGVSVEGYVKGYRNIMEFYNSTLPLSIVVKWSGEPRYESSQFMSGNDLDLHSEISREIKYVTIAGRLSIASGGYYNVIVPGATLSVGTILFPLDEEAVAALDGKNVIVKGYTVDVAYSAASNTNYVNIMMTDIEVQSGPIFIDGDFSDWDALDASKVAIATCAEDARYTALQRVKVYADDTYIYAYIEYSISQIDINNSAVSLYINSDNSNLTGGYNNDAWSGGYFDYMFDGGFIYLDGIMCNWDPGVWPWGGAVGGDGWYWNAFPDELPSAENNWGALIPENSGIGMGYGTKEAYELKVCYKEGFNLADTFTIGVMLYSQWNNVGVLPNAAKTDDNPNGLAAPLTVTVDR